MSKKSRKKLVKEEEEERIEELPEVKTEEKRAKKRKKKALLEAEEAEVEEVQVKKKKKKKIVVTQDLINPQHDEERRGVKEKKRGEVKIEVEDEGEIESVEVESSNKEKKKKKKKKREEAERAEEESTEKENTSRNALQAELDAAKCRIVALETEVEGKKLMRDELERIKMDLQRMENDYKKLELECRSERMRADFAEQSFQDQKPVLLKIAPDKTNEELQEKISELTAQLEKSKAAAAAAAEMATRAAATATAAAKELAAAREAREAAAPSVKTEKIDDSKWEVEGRKLRDDLKKERDINAELRRSYDKLKDQVSLDKDGRKREEGRRLSDDRRIAKLRDEVKTLKEEADAAREVTKAIGGTTLGKLRSERNKLEREVRDLKKKAEAKTEMSAEMKECLMNKWARRIAVLTKANESMMEQRQTIESQSSASQIRLEAVVKQRDNLIVENRGLVARVSTLEMSFHGRMNGGGGEGGMRALGQYQIYPPPSVAPGPPGLLAVPILAPSRPPPNFFTR